MNYLYGKSLRAEIYIPGAENLAQKIDNPLIKSVLDAVTQGGRELIKNKAISAGTMKAINTPTIDFKTMAAILRSIIMKYITVWDPLQSLTLQSPPRLNDG